MISQLLTPFCRLAEKSNARSFSLKKIFLAVFCIGAFSAQAQVSSYTPGGSTTAYTGITAVGGATAIFGTTWTDNVSAAISLGPTFNFNFNGKVYTTCYISSNGFITFGSAPLATEYTPLSSAATYEGAIAAYGMDLRAAGIAVLYQTQGTSPNRTFTVQWTAYRNGLNNSPINTQIVLHESDVLNVTNPGVIDINYNTSGTAATQTAIITGQVGVRGENNTDFNNRSFTLPVGGPYTVWPTLSPILARGTVNTASVGTRFLNPTSTISTPTRLTWTPPTCFAPRKVTATPISITSTGATLTWLAPNPVPANGYQYLVTTAAPNNINVTFPVAGTPATGTTTSLTTSVSLLSANTLYYVYVRSDCGGTSGWSAAGSFTTLCAPYSPLPYTQNFETGFPIGTVPPCNKVEDLTGEVAPYGKWITANGAIALPGVFGFPSRRLQCSAGGSFDNNTTYFIEGVQLTGGVSYRLAYTYGASTEFATTEQSMTVGFYTAPYVGAPVVQLADHPSIKAGPFNNVINFIPASTGIYYIGFNDYSLAGTATLFLDAIDLRETVCIEPTSLLVSGITSGSGTVSWTAPALAPAAGYQYYVATTPFTAPTGATVPTGTVAAGTAVTLGGLPPSTAFRVWVRSNCGGGDFSYWSPYVAFSTLAGPAAPSCVPSGAGFLQDPSGITNVTFGGVNNTTVIETNNYGDYSYLVGYGGQGTALPISITYRTGFTYDTTIWVDWDSNGTFIPAEVVYTANSAGTIPAVLNGTINIPAGATLGAHRMRIGGIDFGPLTNPCRTGSWQAYEDYTLWVTTPPPALTLSTYSATVCQGATVPVNVTSTVGNYNTYTWTPGGGITGTAGSGYIITPTVTTTYVLEAYNSVNFNRVTQSVTITVKPTPSALTISPATATVCQNATTGLALTATGGTISGIQIYSENFNAATPPVGWLQTNNTVNATVPGDEALSAWSLYPDSWYFYGTYHSNDNSQFAMSESDAAGINSTTDTTLTSPAINLTGYNAATLQFYQFYNNFLDNLEYGVVEITTNGGGSWTTLATYSGSDVGTLTNFALTTFDLSTYAVANNTVNVRFRYHATWDFGWAIDNFSVTGSGPAPVTWASGTMPSGLYNDAALAVAYTGDARTTVYAAPTANQTYTATATFGGCPVTSNTINMTVTPISGGTMAVTSQTVCGGGAASAIVLASTAGTVLYWQYDDDGDFTSGAVIIAGSAGLTTLTPALIGTVTGTRYFRAVFSAGGCANAYSPVHTITVPTATWNGTAWTPPAGPNSTTQAVFNGSYSSGGNLVACSVVVSSGTVTFNAGHTLTVQNGVTVANAARLIFEDDASLVQVNNTTNVGDITYKRTTTSMRKYDYTYWSSPVNAQILATFSPLTLSDKYFWFNTTTYQWTAIAAPGSTPMTVGRGYIIRAPETFTTAPAFWTGSFGYDGVTHGGGVPNNGTYIVPVGHNSATNNLDCIGNPYPSAISANLFISDAQNATALGATGTTIYFWTHNTPITAYQYNGFDYASYNYTGGVGTGNAATSPMPCVGCNFGIPSGNIAAGQAFMVKTAAAGSVYFKNTMRLTGVNTQFFRMANQEDPIENLEKNRLWLELTNSGGAYKQILVGYIQNATDGIDAGFDGSVVEAGNPISLYSFGAGQKLSIQGKALPFNVSDEIPLGYKTTVAGTFQIALPITDGLFTEQDVYLEDTLLNIVHDLKQGPYSFTTETGTFDTRFVLRFTNATLGTEQMLFDQNAVVVYKNNHSIFVETSNVMIKSVKIYDLRGRLITGKDAVNSIKTEFNNLNAAQQVLMVQVTSADNVTVTKKIVF